MRHARCQIEWNSTVLFQKVFCMLIHISHNLWPNNMFLGGFQRIFKGLVKPVLPFNRFFLQSLHLKNKKTRLQVQSGYGLFPVLRPDFQTLLLGPWRNLSEDKWLCSAEAYNVLLECTHFPNSLNALSSLIQTNGSPSTLSRVAVRCSLCCFVYSFKLTWSKSRYLNYKISRVMASSLARSHRFVAWYRSTWTPASLVDFIVKLSSMPYAESYAIFTVLNTLG